MPRTTDNRSRSGGKADLPVIQLFNSVNPYNPTELGMLSAKDVRWPILTRNVVDPSTEEARAALAIPIPHAAVIREPVRLTFEEESMERAIKGKSVKRIAEILGMERPIHCRALNRLATALAHRSLRRNGIDVPEDGGRYKEIIEKVAKALTIQDWASPTGGLSKLLPIRDLRGICRGALLHAIRYRVQVVPMASTILIYDIYVTYSNRGKGDNLVIKVHDELRWSHWLATALEAELAGCHDDWFAVPYNSRIAHCYGPWVDKSFTRCSSLDYTGAEELKDQTPCSATPLSTIGDVTIDLTPTGSFRFSESSDFAFSLTSPKSPAHNTSPIENVLPDSPQVPIARISDADVQADAFQKLAHERDYWRAEAQSLRRQLAEKNRELRHANSMMPPDFETPLGLAAKLTESLTRAQADYDNNRLASRGRGPGDEGARPSCGSIFGSSEDGNDRAAQGQQHERAIQRPASIHDRELEEEDEANDSDGLDAPSTSFDRMTRRGDDAHGKRRRDSGAVRSSKRLQRSFS